MKPSERKLLEITAKAKAHPGCFGPPFIPADWTELMLLKFTESLCEDDLPLSNEEPTYANRTEKGHRDDEAHHSDPKKEQRPRIIFPKIFEWPREQFSHNLSFF